MKKIGYLLTIVMFLSILLGCTQKEDTVLDSLAYTTWSGELYSVSKQTTLKLIVKFDPTSIIYKIDGKSDKYASTFEISEDKKVCHMTHITYGPLYYGTWLIKQASKNYIEMEYFHMDEIQQDILKLYRIE